MGEIRISDSRTGKKQKLSPLRNNDIGMYVCGVTVYDRCHLGHARSALVFDLIYRFLTHRGYRVTYVKNFTDIDDKIIDRARKEGQPWKEIAERYTASYREDMARLGVLSPTVEPKATEHISEIIEIIRGLIERRYAYVIDGDVYFEVKRSPGYGRLSRKRPEELLAGSRIEVDERKRDPLDFALWKAAKPDEPFWESPWGPGRPGWHVECSAMSIKHLGETLDIHGGGQDLIFPHHENEVAQSEAYTGKPYVQVWMHNGFVTINQEKMSKSLGNFFTIDEVFEKSKALLDIESKQKIAEIVRYFLLSVHYRSPIDFSEESLKEAKSALDNFYLLFFELQKIALPHTLPQSKGPIRSSTLYRSLDAAQEDVERALENDFNVPSALGRLHILRSHINKALGSLSKEEAQKVDQFFRNWVGSLLGIFQTSLEEWGIVEQEVVTVQEGGEDSGPAAVHGGGLSREVLKRIEERNRARQEKNWARADQIRDELAEKGFTLEDRTDGTTRVKH